MLRDARTVRVFMTWGGVGVGTRGMGSRVEGKALRCYVLLLLGGRPTCASSVVRGLRRTGLVMIRNALCPLLAELGGDRLLDCR